MLEGCGGNNTWCSSGKEHTLLPGLVSEFLGIGLFQRQPHLGTGMVVQEGGSLGGTVGFTAVGTRQQLGRERQAELPALAPDSQCSARTETGSRELDP